MDDIVHNFWIGEVTKKQSKVEYKFHNSRMNCELAKKIDTINRWSQKYPADSYHMGR